MVIQNNRKNFDRGYSFPIGLWVRSRRSVEIIIPSVQSQFTTEELNNEMLNFELDTIDEKREVAAAWITYYK